jgi:GT2 family glycosyltransferase
LRSLLAGDAEGSVGTAPGRAVAEFSTSTSDGRTTASTSDRAEGRAAALVDAPVDTRGIAAGLPTVSVAVFNYNGGERVYNAVRAVVEQSFPVEEILLVDNHSSDGSVERIRAAFPLIEVVQLAGNLGLPAGRNEALRRAKGDFILMLDGDVYLTEGCTERLLASAVERDATLVCPRVLLFPETHIVQCDGAAPHYVGTLALRHAYLPVERVPCEASEVDGCIGACLLIDRAQMTAAGGFDDVYFLYFEDLELILRLRAFGHRIVCEPRAVVHHDRGAGTAGLSFRGQGTYPPRRAYITMRNHLLLIVTFYRVRTIAVALPALLLYELATLALAVSRGWAREWLSSWAWLLRHSSAIRRRRRWIQDRRRLADRDLLRGGPLPLAPGLLRSKLSAAPVAALSRVIAWYWGWARRWAG